jgi:hypothetical protein
MHILAIDHGHTSCSKPSVDTRPYLIIVHRFWTPGTDCAEGEEIAGAWLAIGDRKAQLKLSLTLRIIVDFMARHRWIAQSASQIEAALRRDIFYMKHAANGGTSRKQKRLVCRSAFRGHVARIRLALQLAFDELGVGLDPAKVLVAEPTVGNEVGYRLRLEVRWLHLP